MDLGKIIQLFFLHKMSESLNTQQSTLTNIQQNQEVPILRNSSQMAQNIINVDFESLSETDPDKIYDSYQVELSKSVATLMKNGKHLRSRLKLSKYSHEEEIQEVTTCIGWLQLVSRCLSNIFNDANQKGLTKVKKLTPILRPIQILLAAEEIRFQAVVGVDLNQLPMKTTKWCAAIQLLEQAIREKAIQVRQICQGKPRRRRAPPSGNVVQPAVNDKLTNVRVSLEQLSQKKEQAYDDHRRQREKAEVKQELLMQTVKEQPVQITKIEGKPSKNTNRNLQIQSEKSFEFNCSISSIKKKESTPKSKSKQLIKPQLIVQTERNCEYFYTASKHEFTQVAKRSGSKLTKTRSSQHLMKTNQPSKGL